MNHLNVPKTDRMCDLTSIDEKKLCFNTQHFNRSDFNVERFINVNKRNNNINTLYIIIFTSWREDGLRWIRSITILGFIFATFKMQWLVWSRLKNIKFELWLKELINDDYADFVNLSSSLASLKETIQKITTNIEVSINDEILSSDLFLAWVEWVFSGHIRTRTNCKGGRRRFRFPHNEQKSPIFSPKPSSTYKCRWKTSPLYLFEAQSYSTFMVILILL